jgi:hypothetical protein
VRGVFQVLASGCDVGSMTGFGLQIGLKLHVGSGYNLALLRLVIDGIDIPFFVMQDRLGLNNFVDIVASSFCCWLF